MSARLERSATNRMWSGVAGGIAEHLQIDATVVRAFLVIATILTGGAFLLVYIALLILMPLPDRPASGQAAPTEASADATQSVAPPPPPHDPAAAERRREAAGWLLVALGVVFLLANIGAFRGIPWNYLWPLALIALGVFIVLQRSRP